MSGRPLASNKRAERSKAVVLAETYRQLSQSGLANVSIDEISRVSRVSKTTIYRHWPSRSALLIDACSRLGGKADQPATGSFRGDLHALVSALADQLSTASWSAVVPSIVDAAERDSDVLAMQVAWHRNLMQPFSIVIEQAKVKGELPPDFNADLAIAITIGALFYRRWFSHENLNSHFVEAVVKAGVAASPK